MNKKIQKSLNELPGNSTGQAKSKVQNKKIEEKVKSKVKKDKTEKRVKTASKKASVKEISLRGLLEAGCHFGHKKSKTHPKVKPYIYTVRDGIVIFDLAKTRDCLAQAKTFLSELVKKDGKIVFVATKRQAKEVVREEAKRVGMPYVVSRWIGGTITNWDEIKKNNIDELNRLKKDWEEGKFKKRPKKEQSVIKGEISRLERLVGGISGLDKLFDAIFVVDVKAEKTAVKEARTRGIPIIAIIDSNCDPNSVDYPICANDDAAKSIQFLVDELGKAIKR
ncbi:MAG: 30S ribosomal protein S2 [Patescibacteria group bacterium]|nr:30S ribosomal protein S2 [Patescibacteria group bacterium]